MGDAGLIDPQNIHVPVIMSVGKQTRKADLGYPSLLDNGNTHVPATALWESKVGIMTRGGGSKPEGHGEHMYLKLHSLESKLGTLTSGRKPRGLGMYVPCDHIREEDTRNDD